MRSRQLSTSDVHSESLLHVTRFDQKYLWGGIVIVVVLLTFLIVFLYMCFKKFKFGLKHKGKLDAEKLVLRRFRYEELQKATKNFSTDCLVGSGAFGNVYLGTFEDEGSFAIKVLHPSSCTSIEEFQNEVVLISKVKHENLVGLIGFCQPGSKGRQLLVYEYVSNGSLIDYISGRGGRSLTWRQRVTIAIGAAKGIAHLHEGIKPSIIHRDIKPSNILLGEDFVAKVSDFGLVKSGPVDDCSYVSSQVKGTPGYLDPAYCSSNHLSPFTDVFGFGVILLQLVTARTAITSSKGQANVHIIDWARESLEEGSLEKVLDANLFFEDCNMEMMLKMGQLGLRCVVPVPKERPTMTRIWQELEAALHSAEASIPSQLSIELQPVDGSVQRSSNHGYYNQVSCNSFSQSSISLDNIALQKFHVEIDSYSFKSASLKRFEIESVKIDAAACDLKGTAEDQSLTMEQSFIRQH